MICKVYGSANEWHFSVGDCVSPTVYADYESARIAMKNYVNNTRKPVFTSLTTQSKAQWGCEIDREGNVMAVYPSQHERMTWWGQVLLGFALGALVFVAVIL